MKRRLGHRARFRPTVLSVFSSIVILIAISLHSLNFIVKEPQFLGERISANLWGYLIICLIADVIISFKLQELQRARIGKRIMACLLLCLAYGTFSSPFLHIIKTTCPTWLFLLSCALLTLYGIVDYVVNAKKQR